MIKEEEEKKKTEKLEAAAVVGLLHLAALMLGPLFKPESRTDAPLMS